MLLIVCTLNCLTANCQIHSAAVFYCKEFYRERKKRKLNSWFFGLNRIIYSLCDFSGHEKEMLLQMINLEHHFTTLTTVKAANCVGNCISDNFKDLFELEVTTCFSSSMDKMKPLHWFSFCSSLAENVCGLSSLCKTESLDVKWFFFY